MVRQSKQPRLPHQTGQNQRDQPHAFHCFRTCQTFSPAISHREPAPQQPLAMHLSVAVSEMSMSQLEAKHLAQHSSAKANLEESQKQRVLLPNLDVDFAVFQSVLALLVVAGCWMPHSKVFLGAAGLAVRL